MKTEDRIVHLRDLRHGWLEQAATEKGKTRENGWSTWELQAAEARYDHAMRKAEACHEEIQRLKQILTRYNVCKGRSGYTIVDLQGPPVTMDDTSRWMAHYPTAKEAYAALESGEWTF